jgi:hypothetical protein
MFAAIQLSKESYPTLFHNQRLIAHAEVISHLISLYTGTMYPVQSSFQPPVESVK